MKDRLIGLTMVLCAVVAIWAPHAHGAKRLPVVRIALVRDGPPVRLPSHVDLLKKEIFELTSGQFDVRFPAKKTIHGNWNLADIKNGIDTLLADPEVDLVIGLGYFSSNELCQRRNLPKPVIAAVVADAALQKLPLKDGASGVKNLSYVDSFTSMGRDIKAFRDIIPFQRLAILADKLAFEAIPWFQEKVRRLSAEYSIDITLIDVDTSAADGLEALSRETEAVYVLPLQQFSIEEFRKLVYGLIQLRLPSFSMYGQDEVEAGLLASITPKSDFQRLGRRVALNVQRILLGEDVGSLKVAFPKGEKLTINMATGRAIGYYPTWTVLTEADLLNEAVEEVKRRLSLESAVREALAANLDLAVEDRNVAAGEQIVRQARSDLLPQVDLGSGGVVIDDDRAEAGAGAQPERSLTGSVTGTQLIYSENAWAGFTSQKHLQTSREEQRETVRLDTIRDAAVAYLDVLRANTLLRVEKENLKLTRANLERARVRVSTGVANRSEEFRWESEIASNRSNVLVAESVLNQAESALNRILNRPLEERFATEEADLEDPLLLVSDPRLFTYVDNPRSFRIYRDFVVEKGLEVAPELRRLDAAIAAQERILTAAKRAFWLPTFSAQGEVTELLAEAGEGQRDEQPIDDTDWSVGVFATFPLVSGGDKFASVRRAREELSAFQLDREATSERLEQRIRSALFRAGASYPNIQLSRDAAGAARKNLDLVTDQYVRGVVSIIDLLDAQNRSLTADRAAENAVYDFLVDLMGVQRAAGRFDFFMNSDEREVYFRSLEEFFRKAGVEPERR